MLPGAGRCHPHLPPFSCVAGDSKMGFHCNVMEVGIDSPAIANMCPKTSVVGWESLWLITLECAIPQKRALLLEAQFFRT